MTVESDICLNYNLVKPKVHKISGACLSIKKGVYNMNLEQFLHLIQAIISILTYIDNHHKKINWPPPTANKEQPDNLK